MMRAKVINIVYYQTLKPITRNKGPVVLHHLLLHTGNKLMRTEPKVGYRTPMHAHHIILLIPASVDSRIHAGLDFECQQQPLA